MHSNLNSKCSFQVYVLLLAYFGECSIREVIVACYLCFPLLLLKPQGLKLVISFPCCIYLNFVEAYKVKIRDCERTSP
jgi:hypothetical protein